MTQEAPFPEEDVCQQHTEHDLNCQLSKRFAHNTVSRVGTLLPSPRWMDSHSELPESCSTADLMDQESQVEVVDLKEGEIQSHARHSMGHDGPNPKSTAPNPSLPLLKHTGSSQRGQNETRNVLQSCEI